MKLLINVSGNLGGGGRQVAISFINECVKMPDNEYCIVMGCAIEQEINVTKFPRNFSFKVVNWENRYTLHKVLAQIEECIKPDVVFTVFAPAYWRPKALHIVGFANGFHLFPESDFFNVISLKERLIWKLKKLIHINCINRESDAIICETKEATLRSSKTFNCSKTFFTVSNTCSSYFLNFNQSESDNIIQILPSKKASEFRLLTLSKYYRHKNIELIPSIIDSLKKRGINNIRFVLTIDNANYSRIFSNKYTDSVINIGPISAERCPYIYKECDAMFLPTMLECFSASYPEAMIMGLPIITSHYAFAKNICKNAAVYFNPLDINEVTTCIEKVYKDKTLRDVLTREGKLIAKDLPSPFERAKAYIDICKYMIDNKIKY